MNRTVANSHAMAKRLMAVAVVATLSTAGMVGWPNHADASVVLTQHVYATEGQGLLLHPDAPGLGSNTSDLMPDATEFDVECFVVSDDVNGDAVWLYGSNASTGNSGYAADYYIDTDVTQGQEPAQLMAMGLAECGQIDSNASATLEPVNVEPSVSYDREAAATWAHGHYQDSPSFPEDCTWFASQALWAGGLPQTEVWTGKSFNWSLQASARHYPGPTRTATLANDLVNYLVDNGLATRTKIDWSDNTAAGAQLGDLIAYHWYEGGVDATDPNTGELVVSHLAVVDKLDINGYPTVAQHSVNRERYWSWDPADPEHGSPAGWLQHTANVAGKEPTAWLIHIKTGPTFEGVRV